MADTPEGYGFGRYGEGPFGHFAPFVPKPVTLRVLNALGEAFGVHAGELLLYVLDALAFTIDDTDARATLTPGGWAAVWDLDTTPDPAWLGRTLGSYVPAGLAAEQARDYVRNRAYWRRGTPAAIQAAVRVLLSGGQRVILTERDGSPWHLSVSVYSSELLPGVDVDDITAAVLSQKPIGLTYSIHILSGATYAHMLAEHGPSYTDEAAVFPTYQQATNHIPEEGTIP